MSYQFPLFGLYSEPDHNGQQHERKELTLLSWNLQSASVERIQKQVSYVLASTAHILILSELKVGKGLDFLIIELQMHGFQVFCDYPLTCDGDYYTIIACRGMSARRFPALEAVSRKKSRIIGVHVDTPLGELAVVGVYCPTLGPFSSSRDIDIKRNFHLEFGHLLRKQRERWASPILLVGDFNILEPNHLPKQPLFITWEWVYDDLVALSFVDAFRKLHPVDSEHSWISLSGTEKCRFDHSFIDSSLVGVLKTCYYEHGPRYERLSDHSVMIITLDLKKSLIK